MTRKSLCKSMHKMEIKEMQVCLMTFLSHTNGHEPTFAQQENIIKICSKSCCWYLHLRWEVLIKLIRFISPVATVLTESFIHCFTTILITRRTVPSYSCYPGIKTHSLKGSTIFWGTQWKTCCCRTS